MQIIVNGLLLGGLYALVTVGFSLVWGVMHVVNLAHGSFVMLGAYVAWFMFHTTHLDPFASIPVAMAVLFVLGYGVQVTIVNRIVRYGLVMTLVVTFGVDLILQNLALEAFTANFRSVVPWYAGRGFHFLGASVPYIRLAIFVTALVITGLLSLFLSRARIGMAIRATALHQEAAELTGVTISRVYAVTYAVAAALAGAAGVLVSLVFNFNPLVGAGFVTPMFLITVLGGLGSVPGAVMGGILFGLVEALATELLGPQVSQMICFMMLVVVLAVRPQGLLGKPFYGGIKP